MLHFSMIQNDYLRNQLKIIFVSIYLVGNTTASRISSNDLKSTSFLLAYYFGLTFSFTREGQTSSLAFLNWFHTKLHILAINSQWQIWFMNSVFHLFVCLKLSRTLRIVPLFLHGESLTPFPWILTLIWQRIVSVLTSECRNGNWGGDGLRG